MKKNEPVIKTIHKSGSAFKIQMRGPAVQLAQELNRFVNFGVITGSDGRKKAHPFAEKNLLPEDFRPGKDESVLVNSYPVAFAKGLRAMAAVETRALMAKRGLRGVSTYRKLHGEAVESLRGQFIEGENLYSERAGVSTTAPAFGEQV